MAAVARWRDDISGAIVTGGTATAYTVASYSVYGALADLDKAVIAFTPHSTNGAVVTLNVDGLGAKPLRSAPATELLAGTLILGTPYLATYSHADAVWYLHGFFGNPYNVPLAGGMDFWGATVPNSSFAFPIGQAISRSTYSALFTIMSTTYGVGDGSTTFNLPDKIERVSVMKASSASRLTSTYFGGNSTVLGAVGGSQSHTLTAGESAVLTYGTVFSVRPKQLHTNSSIPNVASTSGPDAMNATTVPGGANLVSDGTLATTANAGGNPHAIVQPTIVCNYILRVA